MEAAASGKVAGARADVLHVSESLRRVIGKNGTGAVYADSVHPNELGHAILSELAARFTVSRVAPSCVTSNGEPRAPCELRHLSSNEDRGDTVMLISRPRQSTFTIRLDTLLPR